MFVVRESCPLWVYLTKVESVVYLYIKLDRKHGKINDVEVELIGIAQGKKKKEEGSLKNLALSEF
ncbi:MAG: hypothetical protein F6K24_23965 [Okeania sp. SIO2D1]|uniref:hypothetical protein n=1 Tax=Okeania sp. SIO2C9 TaxID=2607791 RepID=UPI0013B9A44C|nr:hypothetical protein [Okeania sp. SIO2C9]NEQ75297.1 hypothetical protein [Okeania sp. SIO2C9]NES68079.1 hypothetical protein [Okeania sp. SIO2D1]